MTIIVPALPHRQKSQSREIVSLHGMSAEVPVSAPTPESQSSDE